MWLSAAIAILIAGNLTFFIALSATRGHEPTFVLSAQTKFPEPTTTSTTSTTAAPATTATTAAASAAPSTPPPTRKPAAAPSRARSATAGSSAGGPFRGLAAWVDVYDWSAAYTNGAPRIDPSAVDGMAAHGVQVLEIQTAKAEQPGGVLEPALLRQWVARAKAKGMKVVGWYLPTFVDPAVDLAKFKATVDLGVDGLGVDIESRAVADVATRNAALVNEVASLRASTRVPMQAIVLPPVVTDVINTAYWPAFPWHQIAGSFDVWTPMAYWTNRTPASGYRDAARYSHDNLAMIRQHLGKSNAVLTLAGGLAETTTPTDVAGAVNSCVSLGCVGGGLYDYRTTADNLWPQVVKFRR